MKLEKAINLKFYDILTFLSTKHLHQSESYLKMAYREDYLLNNLDKYLTLDNHFNIYTMIHPQLIRHRSGQDFSYDMKDFIWKDFERRFDDIHTSAGMVMRFKSKFSHYLIGSNFWEFLAIAPIDYFSPLYLDDTETRFLDYKLGFKIRNYQVILNSEHITDVGAIFKNIDDVFEVLFKFNSYFRHKFEEKSYLIATEHYHGDFFKKGVFNKVKFFNFSPKLLKEEELCQESALKVIFEFNRSDTRPFRKDDVLYEEYYREIAENINLVALQKYTQKNRILFRRLQDYDYFDKLNIQNIFITNHLNSITEDMQELPKLIPETTTTKVYGIDYLLRRSLVMYPSNYRKCWRWLIRMDCILFKDINEKNKDIFNEIYLRPSNFFIQRRLLRRDFYSEYLIRNLSKIDF